MPKTNSHINDAPAPRMTVRELVAHLQTLPQDAIVIHDWLSEKVEMTHDDIYLYTPKTGNKMIYRNGSYMVYRPELWDPAEGRPKFLTVVNFPGG